MKPLTDQPQNQISTPVDTDAEYPSGTAAIAGPAAGIADAAHVESTQYVANLDLLRAFGCLDSFLYPDRELCRDRVSPTSK
jgi:hypothetical protein